MQCERKTNINKQKFNQMEFVKTTEFKVNGVRYLVTLRKDNFSVAHLYRNSVLAEYSYDLDEFGVTLDYFNDLKSPAGNRRLFSIRYFRDVWTLSHRFQLRKMMLTDF